MKAGIKKLWAAKRRERGIITTDANSLTRIFDNCFFVCVSLIHIFQTLNMYINQPIVLKARIPVGIVLERTPPKVCRKWAKDIN